MIPTDTKLEQLAKAALSDIWELANGCTFTGDFKGYSIKLEDAHQVFTDLLTRLRAAEREREWQPIETAPKDGTEILGCHFTRYSEDSVSKYGPWTMRAYEKEWIPSWDGYHVIESQGDFGTDYRQLDLPPTHWMPLPRPQESPKP